jgi:H+-transporting ATPase
MSATTPPNHLGTDVPTGELNEKKDYGAPEKKAPVEDEEEDEDMDALIEELESQDANIDDEEEEEAVAGGARNVPEEMLQTSTRDGLTSAEVLQRRKKYGMNQMKEEKENLILKFLGFFIGPIQFVMEAAAVLAAGLQDWVDFGVICECCQMNATRIIN